MPLDYRVFDRLQSFSPTERYQSGVQTGRQNLLFQQLMEDRAEKKAADAENKNLLSTYERMDAIIPLLQSQNYQGALERTKQDRERILADNPSADLSHTTAIEGLINQHMQGDPQAMGQLSALYRELGNKAENRGLIEKKAAPTAGSYVEGLVDNQLGFYPKNTKGLTEATDEQKDAWAMGHRPESPEWKKFIDDKLAGDSSTGKFVMGVNAMGQAQRMPENSPDMRRVLRPVELDALANNIAFGTPEFADFVSKKGEAEDAKFSASTKMFQNGTRTGLNNDGGTWTMTPDGRLVEGQEAADAIAEANAFETSLQGERAGARSIYGQQGPMMKQMYDDIAPLETALGNLNEGIRLVRDEGAPSGPLRARMPAITSVARQLETLQKRMGLDVVGAVTFGSLSAGELQLALDVGMDRALPEADLLSWFEDRAAAQRKMITNLQDAVIFMSVPGRTPGDWLQVQREFSGGGAGGDNLTPEERAEFERLEAAGF